MTSSRQSSCHSCRCFFDFYRGISHRQSSALSLTREHCDVFWLDGKYSFTQIMLCTVDGGKRKHRRRLWLKVIREWRVFICIVMQQWILRGCFWTPHQDNHLLQPTFQSSSRFFRLPRSLGSTPACSTFEWGIVALSHFLSSLMIKSWHTSCLLRNVMTALQENNWCDVNSLGRISEDALLMRNT